MKKMLWIGFFCMAVLSLNLAAVAATIVRSAMNSYETFECQGQSVEISGTSSQFVISGACPKLTIRGTGNTVKVERVGNVRIEGSNNQVVWSQALQGSRPQVSRVGAGNKIIQGKMEAKRADKRMEPADREETVEANRAGVKVAGPEGMVEVNRAGVKVAGLEGMVEVKHEDTRAKGGNLEEARGARGADLRPEDADREAPMAKGHSHHRESRPAPVRDIEINGIGKNRTITCHGENVEVSGIDNHVYVKGECHELSVSGNSNFCQVEAVRVISVSGNENEVAWKHALGGDDPRIDESGNDNKVRQVHGRDPEGGR